MFKRHLKKYWFYCLLAPLFMVGEVLVDLFQPKLMANIVNNGVLGLNNNNVGDLSIVINTGLLMMLLVLIGGICGVLSGVFAQIASQNFANGLRKETFAKVMDLSMEQTDKFTTGSLVTRVTNDIEQVRMVVSMSIRMLVRTSMLFVGGIIMLLTIDLSFSVVVLIALPFILALMVIFLLRVTPLFSLIQKKLDGVNSVMQENVSGARVVKSYVKEDFECLRFGKANEELVSVNLKVQTLLSFLSPFMNIILNGAVVAVIFIGKIKIQEGSEILPGNVMEAITYITMILSGVLFFAMMFQTLTRAKASIKRLNEVLNSTPSIVNGSFKEPTTLKGEIEFRNVSFYYPNSSKNLILEDISFKVKKGDTLGILGVTGSGKTTLVNLIPRFYDAVSGSVLVDGVDVKEYDFKYLRSKISYVLQTAELFNTTISNNISSLNEVDDNLVKEASVLAQADDFISEQKEGYDSIILEGGHSLSGGQKQRISIARALYKGAEIMIFDDSTSALDLKTEANLYKSIKKQYDDTTKIVIAQRIASIKDSDTIIVLEKGRIASMGTHEELMRSSKLYREIFDSQLGTGGNENE